MSEKAIQLIRDNKVKHEKGKDASVLDLGNCGLLKVPEEIEKMPWVHTFILDSHWLEYGLEIKNWKIGFSSNKGEVNKIIELPELSKSLPNLRKLIISRQKINKLKGISGLNELRILHCNAVHDISILGSLPSLQVLNFNGAKVRDLSPISRLRELEYLSIRELNLSNLTPLAPLVKIKLLQLNSVQVHDLNFLANLKRLEILNLRATRAKDLSPLAYLEELKSLDLSDTAVIDLNPLSNLKKLKRLILSKTQIFETGSLALLNGLEELDLSRTQVVDLGPLKKSNGIKKLNLHGTPVTDLDPLSNLKSLKQLNISGTQVTDLSPLSNFKELEILSIDSIEVSDTTPLSVLKELKNLRAVKTLVEDVRPLSKLRRLEQLSLSNTLVEDLRPIGEIDTLKTLGLSNTQIKDLSPLSSLKELENLSLDSTKVSDLSPVSTLESLKFLSLIESHVTDLGPLAKLQNLVRVNLSKTAVSDLGPLSAIAGLTTINLASTKVVDLKPLENATELLDLNLSETLVEELSPLSKLKKLVKLNLNNSKVSSLTPLMSISGLKRLDIGSTNVIELGPVERLEKLNDLNLSNTQVTDLTPISKLNWLDTLRMRNSQVKDLTPISNLNRLNRLDLSNTLIEDLNPVVKMKRLSQLGFSNTRIFDLNILSQMPLLTNVDCSRTKVSDLTPVLMLPEINREVKWEEGLWGAYGVSCKDSPLVFPPVEFAKESSDAVRDYLDELGTNGRPLNEVKVLFLGEGASGKTSVVRRLMDQPFNINESQTHGIRINALPIILEQEESVLAHLWDFGGQEVMHATHQFFLSQRAVYVLLLNSRTDDKVEKWLKYAASFGGSSPVMVVLNKIDENPSFAVNEKYLREKYPQIKDFYKLSCKTGKGFSKFKEALTEIVKESRTRKTPFPEKWMEVKNHFSTLKNDENYDYIDTSEYINMCSKVGITRKFSQSVLLQFLHDLGVLINFQNLKNFETNILNPLWLTAGVYRIINSELLAERGGILHENDFENVINDPRHVVGNISEKKFVFPRSKLIYIVRVMEEFELCYSLDLKTFVVPQLLPVPEPEFPFSGLQFEIHFIDFMPDSFFPRLMVKLHDLIHDEKRWRTGMILHKPSFFKAFARIRWDKEDQKFQISVSGEDRRELLSYIRATVSEIAGTFTDLKYEELVPVQGHSKFVEYEMLTDAEKAGREEIFIGRPVNRMVNVAELLDGVEESSMRDEDEQLPIKAFVSYSHVDFAYLRKLRRALSTLIRLNKLELWDDKHIDAGDEWEEIIFKQLDQSEIIICLLSSDFIASDFCFKLEFERALTAHRQGKKTIVPIWLRPTDLKGLPLSDIQGTPNGKWITKFTDSDEAWLQVSESLRPVLKKARERKVALLKKRRN